LARYARGLACKKIRNTLEVGLLVFEVMVPDIALRWFFLTNKTKQKFISVLVILKYENLGYNCTPLLEDI
jgi:hypothetical protein